MKSGDKRREITGSRLVLSHPFSQIFLGVAVAALLEYNFLLLRTAKSLHWNDFGKFYYATLNWKAGVSMYAPTAATYMEAGSGWFQFLDLNPPHFHLLVLPLLLSSEFTAGILWNVANMLAAAAAIALVVRESAIRVSAWQVLPVSTIVLASVATCGNSLTAQCTGLLMLPMAAAWRAARRDQWIGCGAWLGVVLSLKPFLGLFLPALLLVRQWRAVVVTCVSGIACCAIGVVVFGWSSYVEWLEALRGVSWVWAGMNGSVQSVIAKSLAWSPYLTPFATTPVVVTPLWTACSVVIALVSWKSFRSVDHLFGVTVLASLLISPLGWSYYLWLAAPGALALWKSRVSWLTWTGIVLSCFPLFWVGVGQPHPLATLTLGSVYFWATLLLWLGLVMHEQ